MKKQSIGSVRLPIIGWRERIVLPALTVTPIKAKIDTGARTSSLHAWDLSIDESGEIPTVTFEVHPMQRSTAAAVVVTHPIAEFREVKSSNGSIEERPVILTAALLGETEWPIEVTLTSRDEMGFRMLLGRHAIRRQFLVDPSRSYVQSKKPKRDRP